MIPSELIARAKKADLSVLLGIKSGTLVSSPFRVDRNPSFSIYKGDDGIWRGKDMATNQNFDSIHICRGLLKLDFARAVSFLLSGRPSDFSFSELASQSKTLSKEPASQDRSGSTNGSGPLPMVSPSFDKDNGPATDYLCRERGISPEALAAIEYRTAIIESKCGRYQNRYVSFPLSNGSYACRALDPRNPARCVFLGPADLWSQGDPEARDVFVFESVIDCLSWFSMFPSTAPRTRPIWYVSLNSVSNLKLFIEAQAQSTEKEKRVWLFLDSDPAGDKATARLCEAMRAVDCRDWQGQKDLNDFLINIYLRKESNHD